MKKFEIKDAGAGIWLVSHNEVPKFTCRFENKKFNYQRTISGLTNPTGDKNEIQLLEKMEQWLRRYHREKTDG
ncbi:hypothetical protein ACFSJW_01730 [Flavobacterium artemisiae]|uniref:Uncharacterized protein n=1 Tax=Flavobacterium artemisiae TaxID=2126556 RepID=A0ABW4HI94_9FLAO